MKKSEIREENISKSKIGRELCSIFIRLYFDKFDLFNESRYTQRREKTCRNNFAVSRRQFLENGASENDLPRVRACLCICIWRNVTSRDNRTSCVVTRVAAMTLQVRSKMRTLRDARRRTMQRTATPKGSVAFLYFSLFLPPPPLAVITYVSRCPVSRFRRNPKGPGTREHLPTVGRPELYTLPNGRRRPNKTPAVHSARSATVERNVKRAI